MYRCDNKFHIDGLKDLYQSDQPKIGLILVTGSLTEFYLVSLGDISTANRSCSITTSRKLFSKSVDLPKKHNNGGQSQARFGRLRVEAIDNYITILAEASVKHFIDQESNRSNVKGLILVGPGDKKKLLRDNLDPRLKRVTELVTTEIDPNKTITDRELQEIIDRCNTANNGGIGRTDPLKEWEDALQTGKGIYGPKEVEKALIGGFLKKLFITEEKLKKDKKNGGKSKIEAVCQNFNCTIVPIRDGNGFGEIFGITWYRID